MKTDENLDDLFGDSVISKTEVKSSSYKVGSLKRETITKAKAVDPDLGVYNVVFVKLKKGSELKKDLKKLNKFLEANKAGVRAISWKKAAGTIGDTAGIIKGILNGFVFFIFFVAAIIITNTLSMAALERTNEIGMMRAVGAKKGFIGNMFMSETFVLSGIFSSLGIISGIVLTIIFASMNISAGTNEALQLVFGGDNFRPLLDAGDIIFGIIELVIVTLLASLYPLYVARKITPLEAIARMGKTEPHHQPVARHLGDDRSRRNRQHKRVS